MKKTAILAALWLTGCASVVRGTSEDVRIETTPADAVITTSLGNGCPSSPCVVSVKRKLEFTVTATREGYDTATVAVKTKVSGEGAAGFAGNVVAGGVIGMGVDAVNGAALDHVPNPVIIVMTPAGTAPDAPLVVPDKAAPKPKPVAKPASKPVS